VVGGTASVLAGDKFANGAVTASFGFAFNEMSHEYIRSITKNYETLYSNPNENFKAFTSRLSDAIIAHTEKTGYEFVAGIASRADESFIDGRQYGAILQTQESHIFSAVTQIPVGFNAMMSTSGDVLRIHSHGLSKDKFGNRIRANDRDMKYLPLGGGSKIPPSVPLQDRFNFSAQDAATRGGLATPDGLIWHKLEKVP
jgi:hypothetical protein